MLGTLMTVLFLVARMVGKFGTEMFREEPVRYRVYQPLPWYVQSVRHNRNRRSSQLEEKDAGSRRRSVNSFKNSTVKDTTTYSGSSFHTRVQKKSKKHFDWEINNRN
ncbi:uncharacterized protein [Chiloscyllium punctatum]|uniref:uncharacterized protein isoform X2 n=1 Tax=Chiloscyllium punctatum TaxID=137246 RepID=UPI003B632EBC